MGLGGASEDVTQVNLNPGSVGPFGNTVYEKAQAHSKHG